MAIQICRTAAFKRTQHVKEEEEEKKKAQILEDAKKEGIAHSSGAFKNGPKPSTSKTNSTKSSRFDRPAQWMEASSGSGCTRRQRRRGPTSPSSGGKHQRKAQVSAEAGTRQTH